MNSIKHHQQRAPIYSSEVATGLKNISSTTSNSVMPDSTSNQDIGNNDSEIPNPSNKSNIESNSIPTGPAPKINTICSKCGKNGHFARSCHSGKSGSFYHSSRFNNSYKPTQGSYKTKSCYSCGQFGHFSKDCVNGQKCYNCGEMGHVSNDCNETKGIVCYTCKKAGHVSTDCPNSKSEDDPTETNDISTKSD